MKEKSESSHQLGALTTIDGWWLRLRPGGLRSSLRFVTSGAINWGGGRGIILSRICIIYCLTLSYKKIVSSVLRDQRMYCILIIVIVHENKCSLADIELSIYPPHLSFCVTTQCSFGNRPLTKHLYIHCFIQICREKSGKQRALGKRI